MSVSQVPRVLDGRPGGSDAISTAELGTAADPSPGTHPPGQRVGRSLKSACVFGIGMALQRGVAFLLLPLYTRALTPAQYGTLSVLLAATAAASILFGFGLDMGLFRSFFLYADDPRRKRDFLGSIWRFLIVASFAASVVCTAIAVPFLAGSKRFAPLEVLLALLAGALYVGASAVPLVILRVEQRLRDFMALSIVYALATPTLTLLLVVWQHDGIVGWLIAAVGANAILLLAATRIAPWDRGARYSGDLVRGAVRFGATLIPHAFALWALLLIDRAVLAGLVSPRELGIYSLAASVSVPVAIAVQSLNQAMMPAYANAGINPSQRDHLADLIVVQIAGVLAICLAGALLGGPLLQVMAPTTYDSAAPLVAWIVLGYAFLGLYFVPMNGITLGAGRSGFVWTVSALGAASNVALLVIFVPHGGITAAAIASAAAYLVLLAGIVLYARRPENPVRYRWSQLASAAGLASAVYVAARLTTPETGAASLAGRTTWIAVFLLTCAAGYRLRFRRTAPAGVARA
jgi:O-antigen/teichoic acid export membrane protein